MSLATAMQTPEHLTVCSGSLSILKCWLQAASFVWLMCCSRCLPCRFASFSWVQMQNFSRNCPVCKAGVEVDKVIPIYGRGSEFDPRQEAIKVQPVPPRPAGQRPSAVQAGAAVANQQGVLPALFGFQLGPGQGYVEALTPEQQHQAFLSRLLLMLGSFVIMCLLLF
eukprot:GHRQ01002605.1.p1 GENE.GHRQ01002605.1~~GHRQ01002605.1.p1  ORF type:complete len:167 (+),score=40.29 GHRQ01002605.1:175-675(+)